MDSARSKARAARQQRVSKLVWGILFLVMGVLFTLHDMGRIDLGEGGQQFAAGRAVDGDPQTRWSSAFRDPQWLAIDLGDVVEIRRVRLHWEAAYAREYDLEVSGNGLAWTTVHTVRGGDGGLDEHALDTAARYVRVVGRARATGYGYSLWEIEVFGPDGALLPRPRATASSLEDHGPFMLWLKFWPLLLVASGLPLLIAPRDDGNQVVGLVLTALGTFWQLQQLHLVPWGLRETASLLLIVVGLVILLQSVRRPERVDETEPSSGTDPS